MNLHITPLGSGSAGNSILFSIGNSGFLVDAGFSKKETFSRLEKVNVDPGIIKAILITHEHSDHVKGARVLSEYLDIPTYVSGETARHLMKKELLGRKKTIFDPGASFKILNFNIQPFRISHDAVDPVGFVISANRVNIGFAMDLGHLNSLVKCRLRGCDAIVIESNYDVDLLMRSQRPIRLKRRIAGKNGHLSNHDAVSALDDILTPASRYLFLGHISEECNKYDIVKNMAMSKLMQMNRSDINFTLMTQKIPISPILLT